MTTHTTPTTAAEHRAEAARHTAEAQASFERCDTDGFVSQWASGVMAELHRIKAQLAEHGNRWTFTRLVLVTTDGEATDARLVNTRYGTKWRLDSTDEWLPYNPARATTLGRRGYREVELTEVAEAAATTWAPGSARGLSGALSVTVRIFRPDAQISDGWWPAGPPQA